ncbi:MAG: ATP-binding protein [Gammaproteobacteria bacterium]|nr:MAG: ATP-binding protein [Gammaproteobacteria bacterium]
MIQRKLATKVRELATYYPVVVITGPRQSGKTTLCRATFPDKAYVSLEALDVRDFAHNDPRGFLAEHTEGVIIDEVQHAPELLNYMQSEVDDRSDPGRFILTGSQHFGLSQTISQSLAGRCGILVLLPPDLQELRAFSTAPDELFTTLWQGAYPRIYDQGIPPQQWLADYVSTYVQRDVRQVINISDLHHFSGFLKLCAGRTAQEINLTSLGNDTGISHNTTRAWLSVLETSYIIQQLPAWHTNVRKQVIKAPKLHFLDSGLVCYLLGIREPEQLRHHPQRGAIFESWVAAEACKALVHNGEQPDLYHYRETRGLEIDLILDRGEQLDAIEVKSSSTVNTGFFKNLNTFANLKQNTDRVQKITKQLVYGGEETQQRSDSRLLSWSDIQSLTKRD